MSTGYEPVPPTAAERLRYEALLCEREANLFKEPENPTARALVRFKLRWYLVEDHKFPEE